MSRALLCWLARLLATCCLLGPAGVRAQEAVDLGRVAQRLDLVSRIELLEDQPATLLPGQALQQSGWQAATRGRLNQGVSKAAFWLRLRVENRSGRPLVRWLTLGSPRLEQVDYYRFASDDRVPHETARSGLARALEERPQQGLVSIFPVRLAAAESATLLLRVSGRMRFQLEPELWEPLAYRSHESGLTVRQLVPLCALLGMVLYMLAHGLAHRKHDALLLSFWLLGMVLYDLSFAGHLYRFLLPGGGELAVRSTVLLLNLSGVLGASFTLVFLGLYRWRVWRWIYLAFIALSGLLVLRAACGDLRAANSMTAPLLVTFMLVWQLSIAWAWHRGVANAGLFLLATTGWWLKVFLGLAQQQDWLPLGLWYADTLLPIRPALVLGLVMVFGVVRRSFLEQRAYSAAQAALIQSRQDEQVRLEALVRERTQTLQDAVIAADEANRARSELLARVNQDLCRPATRIVALAQSLEQAGGEHAAQGAAIRRSASDLQGLIDDLIEEAGAGQPLGTIRPEPVDIRRLLEGLATEAEGLARANGNAFSCRLAAGLPPRVLVDPKRLRQILINLLDNAAKFTRAGRVELRVDAVETAGLAMLTLTVSDTGIGMTAEQLAEVFEPYRRAAGAGGLPGLGLGLAIARHWIERMDGSIGVDSAPGRGTTMRVALSLSLPDSSPAVPEPAGASVPTAALPCPDAAGLEQALQWLRLGAVSDLLDWAAELAVEQPECRIFAQRVADLAARGDLAALARCLSRSEGDGGVPRSRSVQ